MHDHQSSQLISPSHYQTVTLIQIICHGFPFHMECSNVCSAGSRSIRQSAQESYRHPYRSIQGGCRAWDRPGPRQPAAHCPHLGWWNHKQVSQSSSNTRLTSSTRLEASREEVLKEFPDVDVRLVQCDLSNVESVKNASQIINGYKENVDIVINNAAVVGPQCVFP